MPPAHELVDEAVRSVDRLRTVLGRRRTTRLVRSDEERQLAKAIALSWFNHTRRELQVWLFDGDLPRVDQLFTVLLERTAQHSTRANYFQTLTALKAALVDLRSRALLARPKHSGQSGHTPPPDFSPLVPDIAMRGILQRRWGEIGLCIGAGADLAATVMIGGLLEGLLLARLNLMPNQAAAFRAASAPRDKQGKTLPLKDWTLKNYIDVGHELEWITSSGKDVGAVVRDYRNYVHPAKELSHGVTIVAGDAQMLWAVFVSLSQQLLRSAANP